MKQFWTSELAEFLDFAICCQSKDASFNVIMNHIRGIGIHNESKLRLTMMVYTHYGSGVVFKETVFFFSRAFLTA